MKLRTAAILACLTLSCAARAADPVVPLPQIKAMVRKAVKAHNWVYEARHRSVETEGGRQILDYEDESKRLLALNRECNVRLLEPYFDDPGQAWDRLTAWAVDAEKRMSLKAAQLSYSWMSGKTGIGKEQIDAAGSAVSKRWEIGRRAVASLYRDQEKWGKVKAPFPLWKDQITVYDDYWKRKYDEIRGKAVAQFGPDAARGVPEGGPQLENPDHKYYRMHRAKVLDAHKKYLATLPSNVRDVDRSPPNEPPPALPPYKEYIQVLGGWHQNGQLNVNPEVPAPWQAYIKSELALWNPQGELSEVASPTRIADGKGVERVVLSFDDSKLPISRNRVSNFLDLRGNVEDHEDGTDVVRAQVKDLDRTVDLDMEDLGIKIPKGFSYNNPKQVAAVSQTVRNLKTAYATLAVGYLSKHDAKDRRVMELKTTLAALRKDKDMLTAITPVGAMTLDKRYNTVEADQLAFDKYRNFASAQYDKQKKKDRENAEIGCPVK